MDQNDVFIGPDTTAGIELPQSPLTRKRTLAGEISRPAADSEAGYPAEEVPNHPEAAADPSGFPAAVLAHSSGASSAVEAVSFRLAADPPAVECPATVGCCPAGVHLWAAAPAAAVPAAAASAHSSGASSAVEAVSFRLAADPPAVECPATVGCCPAGAHLWAAVPAAAVPAAAVPAAAVPAAAASVRSSAASSAVFGHPAIASLAVAALVGLAAKAVLGAELDRRGRGFAVRSD